jgi:hypothetical protein
METRIQSFTQFLGEKSTISPFLEYHINNNLSVAESIFRPGSQAHLDLLSETRSLFESGKIRLGIEDSNLFLETDLGQFGEYLGQTVPLDLVLEIDQIAETKSSPELGVPKRGGPKKYHVYVRNPKTGKIQRIVFGDVHGGLTAKVSNPKARKSFAARHNCKEKNDRMTAGYWACRINRYAHLWGGKTYPGFW